MLNKTSGLLLATALTLTVNLPVGAAEAPNGKAPHKAVNPALWGYSGLLNVPTAEVMPNGSYSGNLRYFPLNSGLSGSAMISLFDNLELGLVFGAPPASGFASMAGSLKYRLISQDQGAPVSLALGASLLGLDSGNSYVPGNSLFLTLSRSFYLPLEKGSLHIANLHGGFMGDLKGARLVGGLEVPVMDYGRFKLEYMGSLNDLSSQAFNFGLSFTPWPFLNLDIGLMQMPGRTFWDRDFVIGIGYSGNFGLTPHTAPSPVSSPSPSPQVSSTPTPQSSATPPSQVEVQPQALKKGSFRIRVIDKVDQKSLSGANIRLSSPDLVLRLNAHTDPVGEARYLHVPSGAYEVEIMKEGWYSESRFISVQDNRETFMEITLTQRTGRVSGRVIMPDGNPVSDQSSKLELTDSRGTLIKENKPEANGSYLLADILPGKYTLTLFYQGRISSRKELEISPGTVNVHEFIVEGPAPTPSPPEPSAVPPSPLPTPVPANSAPPPAKQVVSAVIEGQVKDASGAALSGVRLKLENDDLMVITLSSPEGKYTFREIPAGVFRLSLNKQGFKTRVFQITITRTESLKHDFDMQKEE